MNFSFDSQLQKFLMTKTNLRSNFTLWLLDAKKKSADGHNLQFKQMLTPLITFGSISQFWQIFQYIQKPSKISCKSEQTDMYLFREGIWPMWEQPPNTKGGYYTIKIDKQKCDKIWENAVLGLISPAREIATCINGVRLKLKMQKDEQCCMMQIWMNEKAIDSLQQIKSYLKQCLQINDDKVYAFFLFQKMIRGRVKGPYKQEGKDTETYEKQANTQKTKPNR